MSRMRLPGINNEISMKEIRMKHSDQNCKSQLNLILFFFQVSLFACVDSPSSDGVNVW